MLAFKTRSPSKPNYISEPVFNVNLFGNLMPPALSTSRPIAIAPQAMGCGASAPQEKPEEKAPVEVEQWALGRNVEFDHICDFILWVFL